MIEIIGSELNQWDDKRVVKVTNSVATHVHLANQGDSVAVVMELADSQALIPNYLLCTGKQLCVYAVKDGVTIERKIFSVRKRERPEEYVYDGDQRNYIYELITDAQTATEAANQATKDANEAADKANQAAKSWVLMGEVKGESVFIDDAIDQTFAGFRIFGKTTQDGVPSPDAPVDLVSVENPTVEVNEQSMLVPYTLRGIPVRTGGNHIDATGQKWICDEVDFVSGVYVNRVYAKTLNGSENWKVQHSSQGKSFFQVSDPHAGNQITDKGMSSIGFTTYLVLDSGGYGIAYAYDYRLRLENINPDNATVDDLKSYLAENPIEVIISKVSSLEEPLPEDEIAAYATLHTSRYGTTVSNDQDAYMDIHYYMDAKKYIDSVVGTGGSSAGLVNATVE